MIIVNGFQPLTIITKRSILDIAAVLDPPLGTEGLCMGHETFLNIFDGPQTIFIGFPFPNFDFLVISAEKLRLMTVYSKMLY